MNITKEQLKQIIKEELGGDYVIAMQMIKKFNAMPHTGDIEIELDEGEYGLLYSAVITMQTTEVKSRAFKDEVEVERDIYSKIQKLQSGLPGTLPPGSFLVDVRVTKGYGLEHDDPDTITIYIYPKQGTEGLEGLKHFLSLVSSVSQEITGGEVAQRDLPGLKEGKMNITKEQLNQIIKEEIMSAIKEGYRGPGYRYTKKGMATAALKRQQLKKSEEMKEKGRADALAGVPKDESITHLAYSRAYDRAIEEKSNPMQEQ